MQKSKQLIRSPDLNLRSQNILFPNLFSSANKHIEPKNWVIWNQPELKMIWFEAETEANVVDPNMTRREVNSSRN